MSLLGISKKGKWIIGGVCAFAVVATATTGLAAWVIGQNTGDNTNGQMNVATVNDKSVTLTIDETAGTGSDLVVMFGPNGVAPETGTAVVTASGESEEDLSFTIKGSYTLAENAPAELTVGIAAKLTLLEKAQKLITDKYIVAPGSAVTGTAGEYTLADLIVDTSAKTFTGTYSFSWGIAFGGKNPCEFFDGTSGKGYTEASAALTALRAVDAEQFTVTLSVK